jgi:mono/diheme cytochrome c family protein
VEAPAGAGKLFQEALRVKSGFSSGPVVRRLALAVPLLAGALSGCSSSDAYPSDLTYPLRSDLIVTKVPSETPFTPDPPGHLEQSIAAIGKLGGETLNPNAVSGELRRELEGELQKVFGKPAEPSVNVDDQELRDQVNKLKLGKDQLAAGSVLYRRHCLHCHGLDGGGRGPTGPWLNPHPRDYRQGQFKFISTDVSVRGRKARREDLLRTLKNGIDGTSMPSFGLQTDEQLNDLVSYVIHLSLRGEIELDVLRTLTQDKNDTANLEGGSVADHVRDRLGLFLGYWVNSNKPNQPPAYDYTDAQRDESVRRGYALFTDTKGAASCISCHVDFGRQVPFRYDVWGTLVRPANLTAGVYRGGRRPVDLYWRVRGGIPPSQMPQADLQRDEGRKIDQYWDLVNFVQALPYPQMLPEDVRQKVYGASRQKPVEQHASAD